MQHDDTETSKRYAEPEDVGEKIRLKKLLAAENRAKRAQPESDDADDERGAS
jgi:hypothetical protein